MFQHDEKRSSRGLLTVFCHVDNENAVCYYSETVNTSAREKAVYLKTDSGPKTQQNMTV